MNVNLLLAVIEMAELGMAALPGLVAEFRKTGSPEDVALVEQQLARIRQLYANRSRDLDDAIARYEARQTDQAGG